MGGREVGWSRHNDENTFRDYQLEAERLQESVHKFPEWECIIFNNDYIKHSQYYPNHKDVLDQTSFGFAFKPLIIYETLNMIEEGDVILYVDANHIFAKDPDVFVQIAMQKGMMIRNHVWMEYYNKDWTRRDMFVNMGCDEEKYWNGLQMQGNVMGICKCNLSMRFIKEWLDYSLDYNVMFGNNQYPNFPNFREHRHEQSIMSILCVKYDIKFLNRTKSVWTEFLVPELDPITTDPLPENLARKEADRKMIR
jgi:hypothetical protein